jgi:uncharacterized protein YjbI with pentapeptide repeats
MANPEHLQILQLGVEVWNAWREQPRNIHPDFSGADLRGVNLAGAMLQYADLRDAKLYQVDLAGTALGWAKLDRADLYQTDLRGVNLYRAKLDSANLYGADLRRATFTHTALTKANLSQVLLEETLFIDTNLIDVGGLETCQHRGPSTLDHRTLAQSGPLPLAFLRGCGLNDWEIEATKLYDQRLTSSQVTDILYRIHRLRTDPLIQFYSCFISYASRDQAFAERLYAGLQNKGVRCWFAPEDMKIGDRIRDTIDQQIRLREKLLLILSTASITSTWVEDEVEVALEEERASPERRTVLVPITIDRAIEETNRAWARTIKRTRHIGDFTRWEDDDTYQAALARLLRDLTTATKQS